MSDLEILFQETPNPMAYKFVLNKLVVVDDKVTFTRPDDYSAVPLVDSIFSIAGVVQVYLFENTITVTHDGSLQAEIFSEHVMSVLQTRMPIHNPSSVKNVETQTDKPRAPRSDNPEIQKIDDILDRTIRPGLQSDGGDVEVIEYSGDELKILYQGACGGCPSAMFGTLDAIQNILRFEMEKPELTVTPI